MISGQDGRAPKTPVIDVEWWGGGQGEAKSVKSCYHHWTLKIEYSAGFKWCLQQSSNSNKSVYVL